MNWADFGSLSPAYNAWRVMRAHFCLALSPKYHAHVLSSEISASSRQRVELAVECRAADPQPTGDFGHVSLIMRDGEANGFSLDILQRTHGALGVEQRQRTKGRHDRGGRDRRCAAGFGREARYRIAIDQRNTLIHRAPPDLDCQCAELGHCRRLRLRAG